MTYWGAHIYEAWQEWKRSGNYPYDGSWGRQPLYLLNHMKVLDFVNDTWRLKLMKDFDWAKFSPLQRKLITWLEN